MGCIRGARAMVRCGAMAAKCVVWTVLATCACVPSGSAPPYDAGPPPRVVRESPGALTTVFSEDFEHMPDAATFGGGRLDHDSACSFRRAPRFRAPHTLFVTVRGNRGPPGFCPFAWARRRSDGQRCRSAPERCHARRRLGRSSAPVGDRFCGAECLAIAGGGRACSPEPPRSHWVVAPNTNAWHIENGRLPARRARRTTACGSTECFQ